MRRLSRDNTICVAGVLTNILRIPLQSIIREVCSSVNEQFQHLVAQEEARQRQAQQASALTQTPVKTKMLRRMSTKVGDKRSPSSLPVDTGDKKGKKLGWKFSRKRGVENQGSSGVGRKGDKTRSSVEERADMDFVLLPMNNSGESSLGGSPSGDTEGVVEEIGKQFLAIVQTPTRVRKSGQPPRGPKLKRLSKSSLSRNPVRASPTKRPNQPGDDSLAGSTIELLPPLAISWSPTQHDGNVVTQELENAEDVQLPDIHDLLSMRSRTRLPLAPDSFPNSASNSEPRLEPIETSHPSLEQAAEVVTSTSPPATQAPITPLSKPPPPQSPPPPSKSPPPQPPQAPVTPSQSPPPPSPPLLLSQPATSEGEGGIDGEGGEEVEETQVCVEEIVDTRHKSRTSQLLETMEEGEVETR